MRHFKREPSKKVRLYKKETQHEVPCWKIKSCAEAAKYLHLWSIRQMNTNLIQVQTHLSGIIINSTAQLTFIGVTV